MPAMYGLVVGGLIGFAMSALDSAPWFYITTFSIGGGLVLGLLIGLCEEYLVPDWGRSGSFAALTLKRFTYYLVSAFVVLLLTNVLRLVLIYDWEWSVAAPAYLAKPGPRDLVVAFVACSFLTVLMGLSRIVTWREARDLFSGRYHVPQRERRTFLFMDLQGSSAIAERLGPRTYSRFIRDLFDDMDHAVLAWGGEVYQYLGDGAIITWLEDQVFDEGIGLRCFQEASHILMAREQLYVDEYDTSPRWRAGLHAGHVVTTRVGRTRSSLAMHGDALNVAARLQALCESHHTSLLVSWDTLGRSSVPASMQFEDRGTVSLKGRKEPLRIAAWVNPVPALPIPS